MTETIMMIVGVAAYIGIPVALISGWTKWRNWGREWSGLGALSILGFLLGTASVLLALATILRGAWPYYDPLLLKIYKSGVLILLAGLALALLGSVRRHHLRWQAPILSLAMLALWIIWASAE